MAAVMVVVTAVVNSLLLLLLLLILLLVPFTFSFPISHSFSLLFSADDAELFNIVAADAVVVVVVVD